MTSTLKETARVRAFRRAIANKIPTNSKTLGILEVKQLNSILIDYINWQLRLIPPRPRTIVIESAVKEERRWNGLQSAVDKLLEKARLGGDLSPHLSRSVNTQAFLPPNASSKQKSVFSKDKDLLLNATGYHHFHLGSEIESDGFVKRSSELLFAHVTRDTFTAIGIFHHAVFKGSNQVDQTILNERSRFFSLYENHITTGQSPGAGLFFSPIATSGHTVNNTKLATRYMKIINAIDPKLDDLTSRGTVFTDVPRQELQGMKLAWEFNYLDLGLTDKSTNTFYLLGKDPR